jgi:adenylate cyclase
MPAAGRWANLWAQLKRFRAPIAAIAAFGAVLSGLLGYWSAYQTVEKFVAPGSAPTVAAPAAAPLSIAVLPFQNLTGDPSQEYVADGLTAALTADLSRIRDAFIVNAKTAFAYKDKPVTAQQVGKDLGVRFVLQGSVQRSGSKIRINAQLADASSNAQLWSENFEGERSDLFSLQDRVTTLVANSIGRKMIIVAARESETRKSGSRAADLMLRARALGMMPSTLKNLQQIEDLLRQALALEPNNASVMVRLAIAVALQPDNFPDELDESTKERKLVEARDLALKARELDPDNPDGYVVIEIYALQHGDFAGARRAAETQVSLRPRDAAAYVNLANALLYEGEPTRAIELLTRANNLDPAHPPEWSSLELGAAYFMRGDNDAAIGWLQKCVEEHPTFAFAYAYLAMAYALTGEDGRARAAAAEMRRLSPNTRLSTFDTPNPSSPAAYKEYRESTLVPAWRKAGLPE